MGGKSQDKRIGGRDILTDSQKLSKIEGCSPPHHLAVKKKKKSRGSLERLRRSLWPLGTVKD